jgi:hypothetical protein
MSDLIVFAIGRGGDDPDGGTGALTIAAIAVGLLILGAIAHFVFMRLMARRRHDSKPHPHRPGHVGRTSEFRND